MFKSARSHLSAVVLRVEGARGHQNSGSHSWASGPVCLQDGQLPSGSVTRTVFVHRVLSLLPGGRSREHPAHEAIPRVPPLSRCPLPDAFLWRGLSALLLPISHPRPPPPQSSCAPEIGNIVWGQAVFCRTEIAFSLGLTRRE